MSKQEIRIVRSSHEQPLIFVKGIDDDGELEFTEVRALACDFEDHDAADAFLAEHFPAENTQARVFTFNPEGE